jgi:predicted adenylyl cyclase CyaB
MARNVEIKARVESIEALIPSVANLADQGPTTILQDDTFFACPRGRLKLRTFPDGTGELIHYERPDSAGPKQSQYVISPTSAPDSLREALTLGYGQTVRVRKRRILYLIDRTRVHLDDVENLGHFLELEVVLREDEPTDAGMKIAHELLALLRITPNMLVKGAYADMLLQSSRPNFNTDASK